MAIYKDDKTWTVQCRIKNRDGTTKQHKKRGFLTKKEAKEYDSKITSKISKCHMKLSEFYEIYLTDKKNELKLNWNPKFQFANFTSSFDNPLQE